MRMDIYKIIDTTVQKFRCTKNQFFWKKLEPLLKTELSAFSQNISFTLYGKTKRDGCRNDETFANTKEYLFDRIRQHFYSFRHDDDLNVYFYSVESKRS